MVWDEWIDRVPGPRSTYKIRLKNMLNNRYQEGMIEKCHRKIGAIGR